MEVENRTQKTIRKKKRKKKRYLLRLLIFILILIGLYFILHIEYFTIDGITVAGNKDVSDKEITELSEIKTGENIFDVHPFFAERRIKKNLYIESVDVKRMLPNRIEIIVDERDGKAQFVMGKKKNEKYVVTDNDGRVLEIAKDEQQATLVENVEVKKAKVDKTIEVKENDVYEKAMNIILAMETGDIYFKRLVIDGKKVNAYVYDDLVCKGEYDDIVSGIESGAVKAVLYDLYQKDIKNGTINVGENNYCSFTKNK